MAAHLVLLHTRPGDADIYETIKTTLSPSAELEHVVRRGWRKVGLRKGFGWKMRRDIDTFVRDAGAPVVCTCPILGEVAEFAGATRIDRAAMRLAACEDGALLLVTVERATTGSVYALLQESMSAHANKNAVLALELPQFEDLHHSGDLPGFHAALAAAVIEAVAARPDLGTVILAESRLHPVAYLLKGAGPRIVTIPEPGMRKALGLQPPDA